MDAKVGHFMVAIGALIVHRPTGKILFLKRSGKAGINEGSWEFVYGRIDQFEELPKALKREVQEEIGITEIDVKKLLKVWHIFRGEKAADKEIYGFTFVCETSDEKVTIGEEHTEYRWLTVEEALALPNLLKGTDATLALFKNMDQLGPTVFSDVNKQDSWY